MRNFECHFRRKIVHELVLMVCADEYMVRTRVTVTFIQWSSADARPALAVREPVDESRYQIEIINRKNAPRLDSMSVPLWNETPLIRSNYISRKLGCNAYLKLEVRLYVYIPTREGVLLSKPSFKSIPQNLHPSHSFKYRGLSLFVQRTKEKHGPSVHLIVASGGNAGLAGACAANALGLRCTVYVPEGVAERTLDLLKGENAETVVIGKMYAEALAAAQKAIEAAENACVQLDGDVLSSY